MIRIQKILVPTDFSDFSRHAIHYGCEFARRFDAELHLLHMIDESVMLPDPLMGAPVPDTQIDDLLRSAETDLDRIPDPEWLPGDRVAARIVQVGVPFVGIIRYARDNGMSLIVMGTHGRTGLRHALIGSTAERVVRKAPCPVLTVRPEGHDFLMP